MPLISIKKDVYRLTPFMSPIVSLNTYVTMATATRELFWLPVPSKTSLIALVLLATLFIP